MSSQIIIITGNLGKDPEMRFTPSGQAVTSFSVAVNESYTNATGEKVKSTVWFRVSAWGNQAEACNTYLKKGALVQVQGKLTADKTTGGPKIWTAQDGKSGTSFEINAARVDFLGGTRSAEQPGEAAQDAPEGDLPF